jgi:hypothetical protein
MAVLVGLASGCGGHTEMKLKGDTMGAGGALTQALEAWKAGAKPAELTQAVPPMVVVDEEWNAGHKLLSYAIEGDPIENGSHWRVFAQIKTEGEDKQEKSERVCYAVTINEPMSVVRSDFLN